MYVSTSIEVNPMTHTHSAYTYMDTSQISETGVGEIKILLTKSLDWRLAQPL